jgi:hypothetical protein
MPGQFSTDNLPKLPGAYVNWIPAPAPAVPVSVGSIVAIPFTHDWGPLNTGVFVGSLPEFQSVYGASTKTPGYYAVAQAFKGEGVAGRGGAGTVLCYRMGGTGIAPATRVLTNTTPVTALTLTAKYSGTKGNTLTVTTQDYAADATRNELILFLNGVEVERYRYLDADINGLRDQINASSHWVTAVANVNGVALTAVSNAVFSGGNDGSTLAAGDWTSAMTGLEPYRFSILAPYDLTSAPILASLLTWAQDKNAKGKRFQTVVGGAAAETYSTAATRSGTLNDPNFINIGVGSITDYAFTDVNGNPNVFSTSQFAPRVAGALAFRGEAMSLTFARFADVDLTGGASLQNIADAIDAGVMVFEKDSNTDAPVRINKARTALVTGTATYPLAIFSEPKFLRTMQVFEMEITEYGEHSIIGVLPVNDTTRQTIVGEMRNRLRKRQEAGVIAPGWSVAVSNNPPPADTQNYIKLDYSLIFGRSLEKILNSITVG